ncbi:hypothetical protein AXE80_11565 [Wenyingzhuangia fucanilytica]|uniref:POTRA domain-containing protein n=2 Tax=Wenyingzhuangia fucanilytica TaxID=1790137 RepID=A0A1B1Y9V4_9FLAO|nr:hypothetical protein AXE80_11565 [Wenyingzhuangia fucanilytica]
MKLLVFFVFVFFQINAQVVSSIKYEGNYKTKTEVLKKLTSLKIGQELDYVTLNNDVTLFSRLPVCNTSSYVVSSTGEDICEVVYTIEETNTIIPTINFWTANNQQFAYQLGVKEFNFLGENKQIGAFYRNNGFHSFSVNYTDPFLFNATTGLSVTLQSLTSLEPLYFNNGSADYEYTNSSIEAMVIKRMSAAHTVNIGLNFFKEKYQYDSGFQSSEIPTRLNENKFLIKTSFDYNKLVYYYQYVNGFRSLLNAQYVMPVDKNQMSFYILWNDFFYYKQIKKNGNFATRLRLGIASNHNNPFAPFVLDNNLNIRGVGNIIDRGTAVAVLNVEYRYTIIDKDWFAMQTNVFVDAGNWRKTGGELKGLISKEGARIHPGIGLRFIHKKIYNAVLRIDYGTSIINGKEKGLVFGVGQYF